MFEEAIAYPRQGDDADRSLVVGGLLTVFAFLVLPVLFVAGYAVRVLRSSIDGETEPPAFDDWGDLFVDGLKAVAIALVYGLVPLVLGLAAALAWLVPVGTVVVTSADEVGAATSSGGALGAVAVVLVVLGLVLVLATVLAGLALAYVTPAALAAFAATDRFGAAFALRDLWAVVTTGTYAVGWLLALVVSVVAGVVMGLLGLVPVVGYVVGAFVYFYAVVVSMRLYGTAYADATPVRTEPDSGVDEATA